MKKLFMLFMSFAVVLSLSNPQAEAASTFKDVPTNYYVYKEINELVAKGVIKGFADNTFRPKNTVTRGEFATFVARALQLPPAESNFKDVAKKSPVYDGISRAAKAGIIRGFADGTFKGSLPVTREDMAVMLDRAMHRKGSYTKTKALNFSDASRIGGYAKLSVQRVYYYGVMGAYSGSKFDGKVAGTRAETVRFIYRMLQVVESGSSIGTPPPSSYDVEAIKKKDPFTLTHSEIVTAYGPYVITRRNDIFGVVRGIEQWDYWQHYFQYLESAKEYKYPTIMRPDEWLSRQKTMSTLSNVYAEVSGSYPNYEIIALNGVPFIYSELYTGLNVTIYNNIIKMHGQIIPTPPKANGQFKVDLHYNKADFATYFNDSVGVYKQTVIPYTKDNKSLMVDVKSAFAKASQVKVASNSISYGDKTLTFTNGSNQAKVNGESVTLSVAPEIKSGAQMLPIREVVQLIGLQSKVVIYGSIKRIEILNYTE